MEVKPLCIGSEVVIDQQTDKLLQVVLYIQIEDELKRRIGWTHAYSPTMLLELGRNEKYRKRQPGFIWQFFLKGLTQNKRKTMEIKGKVHCFFEQSGTFKREFIKLGIPAEDYDIQNNFGETDHVTDLFGAIDDAYDGKPTVFDTITTDDLIMAFYPCTYFCQMSQYAQSLNYRNYQHMTESEALDKIIERQNKRNEFLVRLTKFVKVCVDRKLRMIFENPITGSFITNYFLKDPTIKDNNRMLRGDYFVKPTGYWYWNCEPTYGRSYQNDKQKKLVAQTGRDKTIVGLCNEERSMISPDYARNFICDFILGKEQSFSERSLFDETN